jgi:large conductance mechanosensitive channel
MRKEFKEFILRGNVIDLAVGLVIGAAFGAIVTSLVQDILMPPIGLLLGNVDFTNMYIVLQTGDPAGPYPSLAVAQEAGAVTWNYGVFIMAIISFLTIAVAIFFVVKTVNRMRRSKEEEPEPDTRDCPFCCTAIPIHASRCPHCTSEVPAQS